MKILPIILSMLILLLSIAPVMDRIGLSIDSECSTSCCALSLLEEPASSEDGTDPDDGLCNPFMCCSTWVEHTLQAFAVFPESIEGYTEKPDFYLPPASQQLIHSIWHPPKVV